jgi:opacity protein-like surface antigen
MKSFSIFAGSLVLLASFAAFASAVRAQETTAPPVIVKIKQPKSAVFKGEVLHADSVEIIVRDRQNYLLVRTFTFSPKVHDKMAEIIARGGYQYGDKVTVIYQSGRDVALEIKGKPSPPH